MSQEITKSGNKRNSYATMQLVKLAMLSAISVVLVYFIHFPIFPVVPFLEYDPADISILIGTFAFAGCRCDLDNCYICHSRSYSQCGKWSLWNSDAYYCDKYAGGGCRIILQKEQDEETGSCRSGSWNVGDGSCNDRCEPYYHPSLYGSAKSGCMDAYAFYCRI